MTAEETNQICTRLDGIEDRLDNKEEVDCRREEHLADVIHDAWSEMNGMIGMGAKALDAMCKRDLQST